MLARRRSRTSATSTTTKFIVGKPGGSFAGRLFSSFNRKVLFLLQGRDPHLHRRRASTTWRLPETKHIGLSYQMNVETSKIPQGLSTSLDQVSLENWRLAVVKDHPTTTGPGPVAQVGRSLRCPVRCRNP